MTNKYTPEIIEFILKNYQSKDNVELAKLVNNEFGLNFNHKSIGNFKSRYLKNTGINLRTGINRGCFPKGNIPFNKGTKGLMKPNRTSFKKGQIPHNYRPVGSERINVDGYIEIKVADPGKWELKHRYIYERYHGPIPEGYNVMFADKNKLNLDIDNLILVSKSEDLIMNRNELISKDKEVTKTGHLIAKVIDKTNELKRRR